jgi:hypothetical protein
VILAAGQQNTDIDFGFRSPADADECGKGNNGVGNGQDPQPPGNPPINDDAGTAPGNPGHKGGVEAGSTGVIDWSGGWVAAAKPTAARSKGAIDWMGSYRSAAVSLTAPRAANWLTDPTGSRTNRT